MPTLSNDPAQLTLPLPPAPDIVQALAATDERLWVIKTRALPQAQGDLAFLERVWVAPDSDAVPVFVHGESPVPCHPAGVARLSAAAAHASALAVEAAALATLQAAMEAYEVGGPLVVGRRAAPKPERRTVPAPSARSGFPDLRTRTDFVRQLRQYIATVERELRAAKTSRNAETVSSLKDELAALHARLREVVGVVRRRPRDVTQAPPGVTRSRKIA